MAFHAILKLIGSSDGHTSPSPDFGLFSMGRVFLNCIFYFCNCRIDLLDLVKVNGFQILRPLRGLGVLCVVSKERGERVVSLLVRITVYVKILAVSVLEKYLVVATSFLLWVSR